MKKPVVIVQGPSHHVKDQKEAWKNVPVIFSTWKGQEENYESTDEVLYNDVPEQSGPGNYNLQKTTTLNGLIKAKELGFEHAVKIRHDLFPIDGEKFISILSKDRFNFLSWYEHKIHHNFKGYLVDYVMSGPVDMMISLWDNNDWNYGVAELILTHRYFKLFDKDNIDYFLNKLDSSNDLVWRKYEIKLSSYSQYLGYNVNSEHLIQ